MTQPPALAARLQRLGHELERDGIEARRERARRRALALAAEARAIVAEAVGALDLCAVRGGFRDLDTYDLLA